MASVLRQANKNPNERYLHSRAIVNVPVQLQQRRSNETGLNQTFFFKSITVFLYRPVQLLVFHGHSILFIRLLNPQRQRQTSRPSTTSAVLSHYLQ